MMKNWQLKRNDTKEVIELHGQYAWIDELEWSPKAQSSPRYSITGAMHVQQGVKKAGRPITLDCKHARITRGKVKQLQAWASVPKLTMTLTHPNGTDYQVIFTDQHISDLKPIKDIRPGDESNEDRLVANLHFMTT